MSVDQLTQAFANLLGDGSETHDTDVDAAHDSESVGHEAASDQAGGTTTESEPDADAPDSTDEAGTGARNAGARSRRSGAAKSLDDAEDGDDDQQFVSHEAIVEAFLFVGHPQNDPLTARAIAGHLRGVSPKEVDQVVHELNEGYEQDGAAYQIVSEGGGYRMTLRNELNWIRENFYGKVRESKLSQAAIDVLAIVAYHQPILRGDVDKLRGEPSGAVLSQLVRRQLLAVEISNKPRRKSYRTTERFLTLFQLESLDDLPSQEDF